MMELARANGFNWKKELTLQLVNTDTDDPCRVLWTISNAAFGSFTCDEYLCEKDVGNRGKRGKSGDKEGIRRG